MTTEAQPETCQYDTGVCETCGQERFVNDHLRTVTMEQVERGVHSPPDHPYLPRLCGHPLDSHEDSEGTGGPVCWDCETGASDERGFHAYVASPERQNASEC